MIWSISYGPYHKGIFSSYLFEIWIASLTSSESLNLFLKILCFIWEIINFNLKGIYDLVIYVDITLTWIWKYIQFYPHGNVKITCIYSKCSTFVVLQIFEMYSMSSLTLKRMPQLKIQSKETSIDNYKECQ